MATTTNASQVFYVVQIDGADDYGTRVTLNQHAEYDMLDDVTGISAPVGMVLLKKRPRATWSGYLNSVNSAVIPDMVVKTPDCDAVSSVTPVALAFGGKAVGFTIPDCIGTRLSITGRSNALLQFSMDVEGTGAVSAGAITPAGFVLPTFYPMELVTCNEGDLLEFTFNEDTGLFGVFYGDGTQERGDVGERKKVAELELAMTSAGGNTVGAAAAATVACGPFSVTVTGSCTNITTRDVDGIHAAVVTIRGDGLAPYVFV